jgi:hypothetical protein
MMKSPLLLAMLLLSCGSALSQQAMVVFHPGETVHIIVSFEKAPVGLINNGTFVFALAEQPEHGQEALDRTIQGNQVEKISETRYEISGRIPDHAASGAFRLNWISIVIGGVGKQYTVGDDFKPISVNVVNPERPEFPVISDVRVGQGATP